jgi:hypothetical protein
MFCSCWGRDPLSLLKESTLRTCQNERPQLSIHQPVHGGIAPWLLNPPRGNSHAQLLHELQLGQLRGDGAGQLVAFHVAARSPPPRTRSQLSSAPAS